MTGIIADQFPVTLALRAGWVASVVLGLSALPGCRGEATNRQAVYGNVTADGKAVEQGSISFYPAANHSGPVANAGISGGKYAFTAETGPAAGPYRVVVKFVPQSRGGSTVEGSPGTPKKFPPPGEGTDQGASGQQKEFEIEVRSDQDLRLDFDVSP